MSAESRNLTSKLAVRLASGKGSDGFPDPQVDYSERFEQIDKYLNAKVHPFVNQGATAHSKVEPGSDALWLTDHGPEHIATVIRHASSLTGGSQNVLSPYECYLLLLAIHFHDVGNIFGREKHEQRITEVMKQIDPSLIGDNTFEMRVIRDIAMAHGGTINGSKDTISQLKYEQPTSSGGPRVQLLAATLRFADELADDRTRSSRFLTNNKLISEDCEIYHAYADRLEPVTISTQDHLVNLHFQISVETLVRKFKKESKKLFLFEEILLRILKMYKEHLYCSRFMRPYVYLDQISVRVEVCTNDYMKVLDNLVFSVRESGYPGMPNDLRDICPELHKVTGSALKKKFSKASKSGAVNEQD